jgi:hypothetical protein
MNYELALNVGTGRDIRTTYRSGQTMNYEL